MAHPRLHVFNLLVILFCCVKPIAGQTSETTETPIDANLEPANGLEFLFGIINSYYDTSGIKMHVIVSNEQNADATIDISLPYTRSVIHESVAAHTTKMILLGPEQIQIQYKVSVAPARIIVEDKGIHLRSTVPIMVYVNVENANGLSGDSFQVFPVQLLGTRYRAITSKRPYQFPTNHNSLNIIAVVALYPNTMVTIGNQSTTLTNEYMTASLLSESPLSGTLITADKNVSVITGCVFGTNVNNSDADYEAIMLLPVSRWSTQYLSLPFHDSQRCQISPDLFSTFQAIAEYNDTRIDYPSGAHPLTAYLNAGGSTQFEATAGLINASSPIQLIQIGKVVTTPRDYGAAFILRVPSADVLSKDTVRVQPTCSISNVNTSSIRYCLRIYTGLNSIGKISLDTQHIGALQYVRMGSTNFYFYQEEIANSAHVIAALDPTAAFAVSVYAYKIYGACGFSALTEVPVPSSI
jgi:hypothetical protein